MENNRDTTTPESAPPASDYDPPQVFDLGGVFDVTAGSSLGGADVNGQGQH